MIFRSAWGTRTDSYLGFPFSGNDNRSSINTVFNRAYKNMATHSYQTAGSRNNSGSEAGNVASASGQSSSGDLEPTSRDSWRPAHVCSVQEEWGARSTGPAHSWSLGPWAPPGHVPSPALGTVAPLRALTALMPQPRGRQLNQSLGTSLHFREAWHTIPLETKSWAALNSWK